MILRAAVSTALLALSGLAVAMYPHSTLAFLTFQASLLAVYLARTPPWHRWGLMAVALLLMMPAIGAYNGYYLEVATQVGIFVALALGLVMVVLKDVVLLYLH